MSRHPREQLSAYLDGELPPEQAASVERHLHGCTECSRELAIMNMLGGAMRGMTTQRPRRSVWDGVHRRITQPAGWLLLVAGAAIWAGLAMLAWWRAELTAEWIAATGVAAGLILLLVSLGYEQYREWKETRYRDVQR
jgi:anti-sigma factor RsiW